MDRNLLGSILTRKDSVSSFVKKSSFLIIISAAILLSGFFVANAATTYSRLPDGGNIPNGSPVQITETWENLQADLCQNTQVVPAPAYIQLGIYGDNGGFFSSPQPSDENASGSISFAFNNLPGGNYNRVIFYCNPVSNVDENGELTGGYEINLEGDGGSTIFTIPRTLNVGSGQTYVTIQSAINDANPGDTIMVASGTYVITNKLLVNKSVKLIGEDEATTIIDTSAVGTDWGVGIFVSDVEMSNFTIIPPLVSGKIGVSNGGGYAIHTTNATNNVTISHITVQNGNRTGIDINGVTDLNLSYITSKNAAYGNGVSLTGVINANVSNITTSGNAWGGIAVYASNSAGHGSNNIAIDGASCSIGETNKIYSQDEFGFINSNITINGYDYVVKNTFSALSGYTWYLDNLANAKTLAAAPGPSLAPLSYIRQLSTGAFYGQTVASTDGNQTLTLASPIEINTDNLKVEMPTSTIVTGPADWDGTISAPTITTSFTLTPDSGNTASAVEAIEIGAGDMPLTLNQATKLTFAGQVGKFVGWSRGGTFTQITDICDTNDDNTTINSGVIFPDGGNCKISDDGSGNLIVWTKHFTTFITYTQAVIPATPVSVATGGGGGGGGGTLYYAPAATTPTAPAVSAAPATGQILGATIFNFSSDLKLGMKGDAVTELQKRLTDEGVYSGPITGYFGNLTLTAVKTYQEKYGISKIGIVGPLTRAQLNANQTAQTSATPQVAGASTINVEAIQSQIKSLQSQLADLIQQLQQLLQSQNKQ